MLVRPGCSRRFLPRARLPVQYVSTRDAELLGDGRDFGDYMVRYGRTGRRAGGEKSAGYSRYWMRRDGLQPGPRRLRDCWVTKVVPAGAVILGMAYFGWVPKVSHSR